MCALIFWSVAKRSIPLKRPLARPQGLHEVGRGAGAGDHDDRGPTSRWDAFARLTVRFCWTVGVVRARLTARLVGIAVAVEAVLTIRIKGGPTERVATGLVTRAIAYLDWAGARGAKAVLTRDGPGRRTVAVGRARLAARKVAAMAD